MQEGPSTSPEPKTPAIVYRAGPAQYNDFLPIEKVPRPGDLKTELHWPPSNQRVLDILHRDFLTTPPRYPHTSGGTYPKGRFPCTPQGNTKDA